MLSPAATKMSCNVDVYLLACTCTYGGWKPHPYCNRQASWLSAMDTNFSYYIVYKSHLMNMLLMLANAENTPQHS